MYLNDSWIEIVTFFIAKFKLIFRKDTSKHYNSDQNVYIWFCLKNFGLDNLIVTGGYHVAWAVWLATYVNDFSTVQFFILKSLKVQHRILLVG